MTTLETRPKSWRQLLNSDIDLSLYRTEDLPTGRRRVTLEESAWHRNMPAVVCFFRDLETGEGYRLSVFRERKGEKYGVEGGVDFRDVRLGTDLIIEIHQTRTGTYRLLSAHLT